MGVLQCDWKIKLFGKSTQGDLAVSIHQVCTVHVQPNVESWRGGKTNREVFAWGKRQGIRRKTRPEEIL
jgi:hypothetical protein